jgi:hypothetical protein
VNGPLISATDDERPCGAIYDVLSFSLIKRAILESVCDTSASFSDVDPYIELFLITCAQKR